MWAAFFWKAGHLGSFADGWYFAGVSHTALGYGDVVLSKPWRSLGPLCAMNGLLTFGCSTAALFLVLENGLAPPAITGSFDEKVESLIARKLTLGGIPYSVDKQTRIKGFEGDGRGKSAGEEQAS